MEIRVHEPRHQLRDLYQNLLKKNYIMEKSFMEQALMVYPGLSITMTLMELNKELMQKEQNLPKYRPKI
jgi:hypothetical protein